MKKAEIRTDRIKSETNVTELIPKLSPKEVVLSVDELRELQDHPHPLLKLLPPANEREQNILYASIEKFGDLYPILKTENTLLDGRARVAHAIKQQRPLKALVLNANQEDQKTLVLAMALGRRNVDGSQKAMVGAELVRAEGGNLSKREAANQVGVSPEYVCHAAKLLATGDVALIREVLEGKKPLSQAHRELREEQRKEKIRAAAAIHPARFVELRHGRFQDRTDDLADNSVDQIFIDPLFDLKFRPDWEDAGKVVQRKLKIGGVFVMMVGGATSDDMIIAVRTNAPDLAKVWNFTVELNGQTSSHPGRRVRSEKRDILVYVKTAAGTKRPHTINGMPHDLLKLDGADRLFSPFGQKPEAFMPFIEWYTKPGDLVIDLCAGGGAVPAACETLNRRCIACERDRKTFLGIVGRFFGASKAEAASKDTWGQVLSTRL